MSTLKIRILRNGVEVPPEELEKSGEKLKAELLLGDVAGMGIISQTSGLMDSLRNQLSETSKILTQPGVLIPKFDYRMVEQGLASITGANLNIANAMSQMTGTKDSGVSSFLAAMRSIGETADKMNAWSDRLRDAVAGLSRSINTTLTWEEMQQWIELQQRQNDEAKKYLGIDWEKPETYEAYRDVPATDLYQAVEVIKEGRLPLDENEAVRFVVIQHLAKSLPLEVQREIHRTLETSLSAKTKPGPVPLTPEEKIELVHAWQKSGLPQEMYCDRNIISRSSLQRAIKWYRTQFRS